MVPTRNELRRALLELATGAHTKDTLLESLGRRLAGYLLDQELIESCNRNRIGLSDTGWSRYVDLLGPTA